jgi:catechol 2,3-dioxygenase-like lactoylglutathione lyase family enzyme
MNVRGLIWVGIDTPRYEETVAFFRERLGLRVVFEEATSTELECPNGTRVQVTDAAIGGCPVPLFEVDDVRLACQELEAAGAVIGALQEDAEWEWIEVVGPDQHKYELASRK